MPLSPKQQSAFEKQKQFAKERVCYDDRGEMFIGKTICFNGEYFLTEKG